MRKFLIILTSVFLFSACTNHDSERKTQRPEATTPSIAIAKVSTNPAPVAQNLKVEEAVSHRYLVDTLRAKADLVVVDVPISMGQVDAFHVQDTFSKFPFPEKAEQRFRITAGSATTVKGSEGTVLEIPANAFKLVSTGKSPVGEVVLALKEYYKKSEIVFAKLSTASQGFPLESGGMIYLSATANGKACELEDGKKITVTFPQDQYKKGMQLFTGERNETSEMDWTLDPDNQRVYKGFELDELPSLKGVNVESPRFYNSFIRYPSQAREKGAQGTVVVSMVVGEDGKVISAKLLKGVEESLDREALSVPMRLPILTPGKINGRAVKSSHTLPIRFWMDSPIDWRPDSVTASELATGEKLVNTNTYNLSGYVFSIGKMGWINCDRFIAPPFVNVVVETIDKTDNESAFLVFANIRSVLFGLRLGQNYHFSRVPENHAVGLMSTKIIDGVPYIAYTTGNTSQGTFSGLVYERATLEKIKEVADKLDGVYD